MNDRPDGSRRGRRRDRSPRPSGNHPREGDPMTRLRTRPPLAAACLLIAMLVAPARGADPADADWPMLGHDAARSGATAAELRPPFARKWYRAFPDEGIN